MSSFSTFQKRKSIADFLSENLPNQILYTTVKENFNLPDEVVLNAFNEAYAICLDVLDTPELHNARSETYKTMTDGITRSTLMNLTIVYFLLSFHQEEPRLRRYLSNLEDLLEKRFPDVFHPIQVAVTDMFSLIPGSSSFGSPVRRGLTFPSPEHRLFVSIQNMILKAEERPNDEALIVLHTLHETILEETCDWDVIMKNEINRISHREEFLIPHSKYRIGERHITDFVKVMRAGCELRIFEEEDGLYVHNFEKFVIAFGRFFNAEINYPNQLLSDAKTKGFLKIFDKLKTAAENVLPKGDSVKEQKKKQLSSNRTREVDGELF